MEDKQLIYDFVYQHDIGVISTVNTAGKPEAAVVGVGQTPELELIIGTSVKSRKAKNLAKNPDVAFVIGWDKGITVQYEGQARRVIGSDLARYQKIHFAKIPSARKYADDPDNAYFVVTPTWARYTDIKQNPWKIIEITF